MVRNAERWALPPVCGCFVLCRYKEEGKETAGESRLRSEWKLGPGPHRVHHRHRVHVHLPRPPAAPAHRPGGKNLRAGLCAPQRWRAPRGQLRPPLPALASVHPSPVGRAAPGLHTDVQTRARGRRGAPHGDSHGLRRGWGHSERGDTVLHSEHKSENAPATADCPGGGRPVLDPHQQRAGKGPPGSAPPDTYPGSVVFIAAAPVGAKWYLAVVVREHPNCSPTSGRLPSGWALSPRGPVLASGTGQSDPLLSAAQPWGTQSPPLLRRPPGPEATHTVCLGLDCAPEAGGRGCQSR